MQPTLQDLVEAFFELIRTQKISGPTRWGALLIEEYCGAWSPQSLRDVMSLDEVVLEITEGGLEIDSSPGYNEKLGTKTSNANAAAHLQILSFQRGEIGYGKGKGSRWIFSTTSVWRQEYAKSHDV